MPGAKVVYVKNQAYVPRDEPPSAAAGGKRVYVDRFEWHYIPDHQSAMNAIINGEVDYWESVPPDLVPVLEGAEGVTPVVADAFGSQGWMRINHLHAPFNNKAARQAIQLIVDQETYLQAIVGTTGPLQGVSRDVHVRHPVRVRRRFGTGDDAATSTRRRRCSRRRATTGRRSSSCTRPTSPT